MPPFGCFANAIGLFVAALVLPDMTIDGVSFVVAVVIFTVIEVILDPLITKVAVEKAPALRGGVALITTLVGLLSRPGSQVGFRSTDCRPGWPPR